MLALSGNLRWLQERIFQQEKPHIAASSTVYQGRIAPTPSGWLHLGHAATFTMAWERARTAGGILHYRSEDLDRARCKMDFISGAVEDLNWWGLEWDGDPVSQRDRLPVYRQALWNLAESGNLYLSSHSRAQIRAAASRTSPVDNEQLFPDSLRNHPVSTNELKSLLPENQDSRAARSLKANIRFRVPDGRTISFIDNRSGGHRYIAGKDFGDFIVWRKEGIPSYELAVVVDDNEMRISEVVRGEDLLLSTARQLLLFEALGWDAPAWYHCPLVMDPSTGKRMSKTHASLALRELRAAGLPPGKKPDYYFKALNLSG